MLPGNIVFITTLMALFVTLILLFFHSFTYCTETVRHCIGRVLTEQVAGNVNLNTIDTVC